MASSWKTTTIGNLCRFSSGHGFGARDWSDHGLPIIRIQNLNGSREFNYFDGVPDPAWVVEPGELLFAWAGVIGVSFGPTIWDGPRGVLNQHIYRVTPNVGIDMTWLHAVLELATQRIERKAHGFKSNLVHVRRTEIENQPVQLPTLSEQVAMGRVLGTWDRATHALGNLIGHKVRRRDGLVHLLFTRRKRLTSYGRRNWRRRPLGEFLTESRILGSRGTKTKKLTVRLYGKGVVPSDRNGDVSDTTQFYVRRAGQLIYSRLDFLNGAFGVVPPELDGYESTQDLPAFDVDGQIDPQWLFLYVSRRDFYARQLAIAVGGRKARRVKPADFLEIEIETPHHDEQSEIVHAVECASREVELLRQQLAQIRRQKAALMRELVTGQVQQKG